MNGNLVVRIIESAVQGDLEKVRLLTNMLSSKLSKTDPDLSLQLTQLASSNVLRSGVHKNPHYEVPNEALNVERSRHLIGVQSPENIQKPNLSKDVEVSLMQVIAERQQLDKLEMHGLEPTRTILFTGPPGVGKTMSASWLAHYMGLPLQVLDLASVMSSFLGKTGNNLKAVFKDAASTPCVLLLDEFDAIAKHRGDNVDVGELKRLVTVLLQVLDSWPSSSLLIAATNHPELLDSAVWRRFDEIIEFRKPSEDQIKCYIEELTNDSDVSKLYSLFKNNSYSEIKTIIDKARRYCVINDIDMVQYILRMFFERGNLDQLPLNEKKYIAKHLVLETGLSQRKTATLLNLSRPTVKSAVES